MIKIIKILPDIIMTDIRQSGFDGLDMIRKPLSLNYQGRYIILTACEDFFCAKLAIELGVSGYLIKPVKSAELERSIRKITTGFDRFASKEKDGKGKMTGITDLAEDAPERMLNEIRER